MITIRPARRASQRGGAGRRAVMAAATIVAGGLLITGTAAAVPAVASARTPAVTYHFRELNDGKDRTFNQLLSINNHDKIAGYFGSGARRHPSKGYLLLPPFHQSDYRGLNYPHSAQTQVTGLNDNGVTVGFYSKTNKANPAGNANFGFWALGGHYHKVVFPTRHNASPPINQLLGVNNAGVAVGFYVDSAGASHPYRYDIFTRTFTVPVAGRASLAATAISNKGTVVGFFSFSTGPTESFLVTNRGVLHTFAKAGASQTLAFGVNDSGEVVGIYTVGVKTYGFTWRLGGHFRTVNDPHGVGTTIINGVNDAGDLVGFYVDSRGNIDGMLATP